MIERYKVPAHAIVIEPYARHTTTNLRDSARLLTALKAPMDRDALGYLSGKVGRRTSPFDVAFRPSPNASRIDPLDPLDP